MWWGPGCKKMIGGLGYKNKPAGYLCFSIESTTQVTTVRQSPAPLHACVMARLCRRSRGNLSDRTFDGTCGGTLGGTFDGIIDGTFDGTCGGRLGGRFNGTFDLDLRWDNRLNIRWDLQWNIRWNIRWNIERNIRSTCGGTFDEMCDGKLQ